MFFYRRFSLACLALLALLAAPSASAAEQIKHLRLYTLDCGHVEMKDMGFLSDTGDYDGKPGTMVVPCYLIRHPAGTLLWDAGLNDKLAEQKNGIDLPGGTHLSMPVTLVDQLRTIGLTPLDVTALAFSHFHFDHTGNSNVFATSTWIINKQELEWALGTPTPFAVDPNSFSGYKTAKTRPIDGDFDVFGDGSVRIVKAPGHTPGHQVLQIKLKKAGTVILSGDLYHLRDDRKYRRVPTFNYERGETLASMDRIEKIVTKTKARLVVQHDPGDFKALPKFPAYLD